MKPAIRDTDLVIPLYRERESLPALFTALTELCGDLGEGRVLFVDDCSPDGSGDAVAERLEAGPGFAAELLRHSRNQGLSGALRTGFAASRGDAVAWLDADLSYRPEVLRSLLARLRGGADLALASPWHPQGEVADVPWRRILLSRGLSRLYRVLHDPRIHTWSGMVRIWRRDLLARCLPTRPGHLGVTESLLRAVALGADIVEVPARLAWQPGRQSSLSLGPAIRGHLGLLRDVLLDRLDEARPGGATVPGGSA